VEDIFLDVNLGDLDNVVNQVWDNIQDYDIFPEYYIKMLVDSELVKNTMGVKNILSFYIHYLC